MHAQCVRKIVRARACLRDVVRPAVSCRDVGVIGGVAAGLQNAFPENWDSPEPIRSPNPLLGSWAALYVDNGDGAMDSARCCVHQ